MSVLIASERQRGKGKFLMNVRSRQELMNHWQLKPSRR